VEAGQRYHGGLSLSFDQQSRPGLGQRDDAQVLWEVVREAARRAGIEKLAPQFLLGHISIQTTERYLGCKQKFRDAVNDRMGIEPNGN
jgi:hypothetical protein